MIYHRFGENRFPSTNTPVAQLEDHIRLLQEGDFQILALPEIVASLLGKGPPLPEKTVAITVDDAFASVYREAFPRLQAAGMPFTLFVATDEIDRGGAAFMTWDQIRELAAAGVTIGAHSASHGHMADHPQELVTADLARSNQRFLEELGAIPDLFAYPYGEFSLETKELAAAAGYTVAFGQQSGVANRASDPFALPRFPMNQAYGNEERFLLAVKALPFPVHDVRPADPLIVENPPSFAFSVDSQVVGPADIACYAPGMGTVPVSRREERVTVTLTKAFPVGRARINCTQWAAPERFRWYGVQFLVR
ncbi:MAG: polysaccharide deacetylase family protein [Pseudomonadota bacterium]